MLKIKQLSIPGKNKKGNAIIVNYMAQSGTLYIQSNNICPHWKAAI